MNDPLLKYDLYGLEEQSTLNQAAMYGMDTLRGMDHGMSHPIDTANQYIGYGGELLSALARNDFSYFSNTWNAMSSQEKARFLIHKGAELGGFLFVITGYGRLASFGLRGMYWGSKAALAVSRTTLARLETRFLANRLEPALAGAAANLTKQGAMEASTVVARVGAQAGSGIAVKEVAKKGLILCKGDKNTGLMHLLARHNFHTKCTDVSKFAKGMNKRDIEHLIKEGWKIKEKTGSVSMSKGYTVWDVNMGKVIGFSEGGKAHKLRIVAEHGKQGYRLITAYPYN